MVVQKHLPNRIYSGKVTRFVLAKCSCGNEKEYTIQQLRAGKTNSCGCLRKEITSKRAKTHGGANTKLYNVWKAMRQRCNNPNCSDYPYYGARGITICKDWEDFSNFSNWAMSSGYKPSLTIERTDNDIGYSPSNCCWVTMKIQAKNRRQKGTSL